MFAQKNTCTMFPDEWEICLITEFHPATKYFIYKRDGERVILVDSFHSLCEANEESQNIIRRNGNLGFITEHH